MHRQNEYIIKDLAAGAKRHSAYAVEFASQPVEALKLPKEHIAILALIIEDKMRELAETQEQRETLETLRTVINRLAQGKYAVMRSKDGSLYQKY